MTSHSQVPTHTPGTTPPPGHSHRRMLRQRGIMASKNGEGVPCRLPASECPSHLPGKCERMLGSPPWWWHQGVRAFFRGRPEGCDGHRGRRVPPSCRFSVSQSRPRASRRAAPSCSQQHPSPSLPGGMGIPASPCLGCCSPSQPRAKPWTQRAAGSQASLPPASFG